MTRWRLVLGGCLALLAACAWSAAAGEKKAEPFEVKDQAVRVSGPYVHENLAVFLLHAKDQDRREFLTLDQGLDRKVVRVTEKEQEQVGELVIENRSDQFLFLQEGDRLQGGKQDRIIITSLVVPPKSGKMPVPSFCIEQSRWQLGKDGKAFGKVETVILAGQGVRTASKAIPDKGGQGAVWEAVARQKQAAQLKLGSGYSNSSLNETLDSPQVKKICAACAKALDGVPAKHADAVGVAIAVNGKVAEVNLYPNARLLRQIYPRLVQSFAVHAALEKDALKGKPAPAVSAEDVKKFMAGGKEKARRFEGVNSDNKIRIRELASELECATAYKGQIIHRQWLNKAALPQGGKESGRQGRDKK
jgi:hypothetical protein